MNSDQPVESLTSHLADESAMGAINRPQREDEMRSA